MGVDIVIKATEHFRKGWSRGRDDLLSERLFDKAISLQERTILLHPTANGQLHSGEQLTLRTNGRVIIAYRGTTRVGECTEPPDSIMHAVRRLGGAAVGEVKRIHEISRAADLAIS